MIYTLVRKDDNDKVNAVISFDSISSVDESWSATVTSQTVEYGFNISDHINIEAPTYSITAVLSSYSLFNQNKEIVWDGTDFKSNDTTDRNSHIVARDEIIEIFKDRSVLTLVESTANSNNENITEKYSEITSAYTREIKPCVITSLSIGHPDQGSGAFLVSMTVQKIELARIEVSELGEGETRALLKPLAKTYEEKSASTKKEDGFVDPETGLPDDDVSKTSKNNYEEKKAYWDKRLGVTQKDSQISATKKAEHYMSVTGEPATVVDIAGVPTAITGYGKDASGNYGVIE